MSEDGETKDDVKVPEGEIGEKINRLFTEEEKDTSKYTVIMMIWNIVLTFSLSSRCHCPYCHGWAGCSWSQGGSPCLNHFLWWELTTSTTCQQWHYVIFAGSPLGRSLDSLNFDGFSVIFGYLHSDGRCVGGSLWALISLIMSFRSCQSPLPVVTLDATWSWMTGVVRKRTLSDVVKTYPVEIDVLSNQNFRMTCDVIFALTLVSCWCYWCLRLLKVISPEEPTIRVRRTENFWLQRVAPVTVVDAANQTHHTAIRIIYNYECLESRSVF